MAKQKDNVHSGHRERLRKRFFAEGLDGFEDHEVLELLLTYVIQRKNVNPIAHELISQFGSIASVLDAPYYELQKIEGIGEGSAKFLNLMSQVSRRYRISLEASLESLKSPDKLGDYLTAYFSHERSEVVVVICLNALRQIIGLTRLSSGTVNSAVVSRRQIVEIAFARNATGVILSHNHTSGIALPSAEDELTTRKIKEVLAMVGVELLDHIIVAGDDYVSMADSNLL